MFTLDETTGDISIDFTAEDGTVSKVVVPPPPTFGAYKRLRAEVAAMNRRTDEMTASLREDDQVGAFEMRSKVSDFQEEQVVGWWKLVMCGDESYAGRATPAPPEDTDLWPTYLASNDALAQALAHWKSVPLHRG